MGNDKDTREPTDAELKLKHRLKTALDYIKMAKWVSCTKCTWSGAKQECRKKKHGEVVCPDCRSGVQLEKPPTSKEQYDGLIQHLNIPDDSANKDIVEEAFKQYDGKSKKGFILEFS